MKLSILKERDHKYRPYYDDIFAALAFINEPLTLIELALLTQDKYPKAILAELLTDSQIFLTVKQSNAKTAYMLSNRFLAMTMQEELQLRLLALAESWIHLFKVKYTAKQASKVYVAELVTGYEGSLYQKIFDVLFNHSEIWGYRQEAAFVSCAHDTFYFLLTHTVHMVHSFSYYHDWDRLNNEVWFGDGLVEAMLRSPAIDEHDSLRLDWIEVLIDTSTACAERGDCQAAYVYIHMALEYAREINACFIPCGYAYQVLLGRLLQQHMILLGWQIERSDDAFMVFEDVDEEAYFTAARERLKNASINTDEGSAEAYYAALWQTFCEYYR